MTLLLIKAAWMIRGLRDMETQNVRVSPSKIESVVVWGEDLLVTFVDGSVCACEKIQFER